MVETSLIFSCQSLEAWKTRDGLLLRLCVYPHPLKHLACPWAQQWRLTLLFLIIQQLKCTGLLLRRWESERKALRSCVLWSHRSQGSASPFLQKWVRCKYMGVDVVSIKVPFACLQLSNVTSLRRGLCQRRWVTCPTHIVGKEWRKGERRFCFPEKDLPPYSNPLTHISVAGA